MDTMKYFIVALLVVFGSLIYLNRAYSHIFSYLNANNPGSPKAHVTFSFDPLSPDKNDSKITYVALGDSLTAGAGAAVEAEAYPNRLAKLLADNKGATVTLQNLGEPGEVSGGLLKYQVPQVTALRPDLVTVLIGVNDLRNRVSPELFKQNIINIVDSLVSTTPHLYVVNIPYIGSRAAHWPPYRMYLDMRTRYYNKLLLDAIKDKKVTLIDLYSFTREKAFDDGGYYSRDGFHPSAAAYDWWAKLIYDHLNF